MRLILADERYAETLASIWDFRPVALGWGRGPNLLVPANFSVTPVQDREEQASRPIGEPRYDLRIDPLFKEQLKKIAGEKAKVIVNALEPSPKGENAFRIFSEQVLSETGNELKCERWWLTTLNPDVIKKNVRKIDPETLNGPVASLRFRDWLDLVMPWLAEQKARQYRPEAQVYVHRTAFPILAWLAAREEKVEPQHWVIDAELMLSDGTLQSARWSDADGERIWQRTTVQTILKGLPQSVTATNIVVQKDQIEPPGPMNGMDLLLSVVHRFNMDPASAVPLLEQSYICGRISYPWVHTRSVPKSLAQQLRELVEKLPETFNEKWLAVKEARTEDLYHAVVPTGRPANPVEEWLLAHYLALGLPPAEEERWTVTYSLEHASLRAAGKRTVYTGWKSVYPAAPIYSDPLPDVVAGETTAVVHRAKVTEVPAGDKGVSLIEILQVIATGGIRHNGKAFHDVWIGTLPGLTRYIPLLLRKGYIEQEGTFYRLTEDGYRALELVNDKTLTSFMETANWELSLRLLEEEKVSVEDLRRDVQRWVESVRGENYLTEDTNVDYGKCPFCGGQMMDAGKVIRCTDLTCNFIVPKTIARRPLLVPEIRQLLKDGKVGPLVGFISKKKGGFEATVIIKPSKSVELIFEKKTKQEISKEVLGKCPVCQEGLIQESSKGYGCSRWQEGCQFVIWKELYGRKIDKEEVKILLAKGEVGPLTGFVAKETKREYTGYLVLDPLSKTGRYVQMTFDIPNK